MTLLRDEDVVLDSHTDPPECLRDEVLYLARLLLQPFEFLAGGRSFHEAALEPLVEVVFETRQLDLLPLVDIDTGLDGERHSRLQDPGLSFDPIGTGIVHIEAQPVTGAVHEELAVVMHRDRIVYPQRQEL